MTSINAQQVARDISETIRNGEKVNLGEIIRENGYAESTSEKPKLVTETKSFKEAIEPIVDKMKIERQRLMDSITTKNLDEVTYKDSVSSIDTLTKNIQLLSGKDTERKTLILEDKEQIDKAIDAIIQAEN
ncbi:MAG: hypothetical protein WCO06_01460 [Candidatus Roizmanbacteria bacterium]